MRWAAAGDVETFDIGHGALRKHDIAQRHRHPAFVLAIGGPCGLVEILAEPKRAEAGLFPIHLDECVHHHIDRIVPAHLARELQQHGTLGRQLLGAGRGKGFDDGVAIRQVLI